MILSLIVGLGLPLLGTTAGAACVFFYEEADESVIAESFVRICGGRYGGCIYLEPADPCDGAVGSNGEACISPGNYRFLAGNYIFITDRYSDATFTY